MVERTLRRNKGRSSATVIRASDDVTTTGGNSSAVNEPSTGESDGTVVTATINDYELDGTTDGNSTEFVDPASASNRTPDNSDGRKRRSDAGKPRGRRTSRNAASETTSSIANLLFTVHLGMANLFGTEVFAITPDESNQLAKAVTNLSQYYDIPVVSDKALAWVNLATTLGAVYGPRFVALKMHKKQRTQTVTFESVTGGRSQAKQPITITEAQQEAKENAQ